MIKRVCLNCGRAYLRGYRGRCGACRQTTAQRGYGAAHRAERAAALDGARCEMCGCTVGLQRDHRNPSLTGAWREHPSNKRWLCDCVEHRCHSRHGVRVGRGHHAVEIATAPHRTLTTFRE